MGKASTALANGAAIFVTEWGTEQNGEGNFDETHTWLEFLRQNSISNANWGVYDKDTEAWDIVHHAVGAIVIARGLPLASVVAMMDRVATRVVALPLTRQLVIRLLFWCLFELSFWHGSYSFPICL